MSSVCPDSATPEMVGRIIYCPDQALFRSEQGSTEMTPGMEGPQTLVQGQEIRTDLSGTQLPLWSDGVILT